MSDFVCFLVSFVGGGGGGMFPITQEYANINCFNVNIDAFYKIGFSVIYWAFCKIELSVQLSFVWDWTSNEIELCMRLNFQWDWAFYKIELSARLSFLWHWASYEIALSLRLRFLQDWDLHEITLTPAGPGFLESCVLWILRASFFWFIC